jgi:hypothetical protein
MKGLCMFGTLTNYGEIGIVLFILAVLSLLIFRRLAANTAGYGNTNQLATGFMPGASTAGTITTGSTRLAAQPATATPPDLFGNDVATGTGLPVTIFFQGPAQTPQNQVQGQILAWCLGGFSLSIFGQTGSIPGYGSPSTSVLAPAGNPNSSDLLLPTPVTVTVYDVNPVTGANNVAIWQGVYSQLGYYNVDFSPPKKFPGGDSFSIVATGMPPGISVTMSIKSKYTEYV